MRNVSLWQAVVIAGEMGAALAVAVLVGLVAGQKLDDWLRNSTPIFTMVGSLVGLAAGVFASTQLVRFLTSSQRE